MSSTETPRLAFGYSAGIPEGVTVAWGARLIAPCDLLWDRQDLISDDDQAKAALVAWLNGAPAGTGAIAKMQERLRELHTELRYSTLADEQFTVHEDETGIIVGNFRGNSGYVYVAGWLKEA